MGGREERVIEVETRQGGPEFSPSAGDKGGPYCVQCREERDNREEEMIW